ncbi:alpha-galactosidase [Salinibacterium sp.]|uniref:alpha-galactosidase n=1 Tax=Salinibacterium sp. TaxID=1915057 RepID=UPI00286CF5E0|nr:alpha-galactosidase [Salinibacterium sp.]
MDARGAGVPSFLHWGADLGALTTSQRESFALSQLPPISPSSIDSPRLLSILPVESEGWSGTPGISGFRGGQPTELSFELVGAEVPDAASATFMLRDVSSELIVELKYGLSPQGVLAMTAVVTNTGSVPWTLARLGISVPIPTRAREVLDLTGRWAFERQPQRRDLAHGTWSRQTRHGRNGHDSPELFAAGTPGFAFRAGEVWVLHLAWSGDHDMLAESHATGQSILGAAELLKPGEIQLAHGEHYSTPTVLGAWSDSGLDGISERFHSWARAARARPLAARPVILNTWEAVYFDHDFSRLAELARRAAVVGVERFVLDDGWMTGRVDDSRALGDWTVDPVRWPRGLHPLVDHVHSLGMDFGLWVEPEMVSLDSELARTHPEWILASAQSWRNQYALDLGNPEAFANILGQLCALLDEYDIAYLKWDQNRDLLGGSTHRQTVASWQLMAALRSRYPGLEIESCSSGGGRVDLGVLEHTDRVWASDTNDPLERQVIHRYTSIVLPPEVIGGHVGERIAHTTGRSTDLSFRLATAFFWSAGIEWDLTSTTDDDLASATLWIAAYQRHRGLLHSGTVVRVDAADPALQTHGVVAPDRSEALFAAVCLTAPRDAASTGLVFPGLDIDADYRLDVLDLGAPVRHFHGSPQWLRDGGVTLPGRILGGTGIAWPSLQPQQALVMRLERL